MKLPACQCQSNEHATLHVTWAPYGISYCKVLKCQMRLNWNAIRQHSYEWYEHCTSMEMPLLKWYSWCFSWHEGRRWTCTPHPFLQQKVHHVIIRKLPKPKVTLFHACTISLFIISEMQNWSWLAWFQSSYLQMLITLDITDSTTATPYSKLHATVKWVMNVQSNLEERVFCKPLNLNVFHKHRSKFTIRNARHNLRHRSLNFYMKVDALIP